MPKARYRQSVPLFIPLVALIAGIVAGSFAASFWVIVPSAVAVIVSLYTADPAAEEDDVGVVCWWVVGDSST